MATMRVITGGEDEEAVVQHVRRALRDPEIASFTVHKPGAHLAGPGGAEYVVGTDGRTHELGVHCAQAVMSC